MCIRDRIYADDITLKNVIVVPFCPQSELSGIEDKDFMSSVWYKRTFELTEDQLFGRVYAHFGAVDYLATVYVCLLYTSRLSFPFEIMTVGGGSNIFLKNNDFVVMKDMIISSETRRRIGSIAYIRGMSGSDRGAAATSDIKKAVVSSESCISPTCRFPVSLMDAIRIM